VPASFRVHFAVVLVLWSLIATACVAGSQGASPKGTVTAYAVALRDGRTADAYALLSNEAKKSIPFQAFKTMVEENPEEVKQLSQALTRPSGTARVTATVTAPHGETLLLVYENGAWKIDASAIDLYNQDTPQAALLAFVRAYENKRYDVLMRFVPDAKRPVLEPNVLKKAFEGEQREEVERLTQALKASLSTAKIERIGDRATMSYGAGGTVELVREHGRWKIEEF
jgi:hypothetical protein